MTRIVIVNEKDEVIGAKEREALLPTDMYRIACLWVTNKKGEVLMVQRALSKKKSPGRWSTAVAGHVDEGEDYEDAIIREAEEELGLTLDCADISLGPKMHLTQPTYAFFCQWYRHVTDKSIEDLVPQAEEVEQLAWVTLEQLRHDFQNNPDKFVSTVSQWWPQLLEMS
jgi:isopentenyl-diphosphate Delta-isomerase